MYVKKLKYMKHCNERFFVFHETGVLKKSEYRRWKVRVLINTEEVTHNFQTYCETKLLLSSNV